MHVMLDLETLSTRPDATLLQVAVVQFEPVPAGKVLVDDAWNAFVDPASQKGSHVDIDTVMWWLGQSEDARRGIIMGYGESQPLGTVLLDIDHWLNDLGEFDKIWAKPASFDLPILQYAYQSMNLKVPWDHRQGRCLRTHLDTHSLPLTQEMMAHDRAEKLLAEAGHKLVKHDALTDAVVQACEFQASL